MSSAELLDLLDGLPDTSRYKGALRGYPFGLEYEWAPEEYREARIAKELAAMNSANGDLTVALDYTGIFSPRERMAIEAQKKAADEERQGAMSVTTAALYARVPVEKRPRKAVI